MKIGTVTITKTLASSCIAVVNGRGVTSEGNRIIVDVAPSLLSNRVAAKQYGVEKEAQKLRMSLEYVTPCGCYRSD